MPEHERLGILETELRGHTKADEVGFARINADTAEIKGAVQAISVKMDSMGERIHGRIDEEAGKARHALGNAQQTARSETKIAMDFAQDAHGRIDKLKIWLMSNVVTALVALLAVMWALIERMGYFTIHAGGT